MRCETDEVSVGFYFLETGQYEEHTYTAEEISAARIEARVLADHLASI